MLDGGYRAFVDTQAHGYPVAGQLFCGRFDPGVVSALGNVGAQDFQLQALQRGPAEHLPFFQARPGQGIHQHIGFDVLVAFDLDGGNRWPLLHRQNQHATITAGLDIGKQSGAEQILDGARQAGFVNLLTNIDRESGKYGTGGYPLQAFYLDVRNRKFIRQRWLHTGCGNGEANGYS